MVIKPNCRLKQAYTLIELLAVMFVVGAPVLTAQVVGGRHGAKAGLGAGLLAFLASAGLVVLFYRWTWSRNKRRRRELREKYRTIYRVIALPTDTSSIVKPSAAEIKIGDYGWEARPLRKDGLVHLQGLTDGWKVVWHAGFRPEQLEKVAAKPGSQYDQWVPYWVKSTPPPCPFPVLERNTPTMGLPHFSGRYFVNHPSQHHEQRGEVLRD